jgi:predicted amidohydrolase YtcJ
VIDLVLLGGDVRCMDGTRASAVAVAGGRIAAVGDDVAVRELAGRDTELVALEGRTVLPGINDSHAHVGWWALATAPGVLDLRAAPSIAAIRRMVEGARTDGWILGFGWDQTRLSEGRLPTRADLDANARPVALTHFSGHALWVNGAALDAAGIDRSTTVPDGSVIVRDDAGEPTGVLIEPGATRLVAQRIPEPAVGELADVLERAIARLHERGITSFTEPALAPGDPDRAFTGRFADAYAALARAGRLHARVGILEFFHTNGATSADDVRAGVQRPALDADPRLLRIAGVKLFADGVFSGRTSWVKEPYRGGGRGSLVLAGADDDARLAQLREAVSIAHRAGRQVQIHATGDAAIEACVDALVDATSQTPRPDPRHVIIHGVLAGRDVLARMARHGILLNAQPTIARLVGANLVRLLGSERATQASPLRWAREAGVEVALSTDIPISPAPDWRATVADAVTHAQPLTVDEALRGVTVAGAVQDHAEEWKGTIEPGKVADLCILDGRLPDDDIDALRELAIAGTIFDGRFVHRAPGL